MPIERENMSNTSDKSAGTKQMMDNLQNELDFAVFEQEEMDADKVREILNKMENIDPEADKVKAEFDKDLVWKKIQEQCREELAEESAIDFEGAKAGLSKKTGKDGSGKTSARKKNSGKVRRITLTAATIVVAVFVGANIGTYATEKKNVIEYMQDLQNGTSFWVTGDVPSMEVEKDKEVYYSWNDVPNEYKEYLVIPQGLPEDMGLYDIKVTKKETHDEIVTRYIDEDVKKDFSIQITIYQNKEFSFANLMYDDKYESLEQKMIGNINVSYFFIEESEIVAQFINKNCVYTFGGSLNSEMMQDIVEETVDSNF